MRYLLIRNVGAPAAFGLDCIAVEAVGNQGTSAVFDRYSIHHEGDGSVASDSNGAGTSSWHVETYLIGGRKIDD